MRHYKAINALACNASCASGFKTDRQHGLIYGPFKFENGQFALTWEQASRRSFFCAYCRKPAKLEIQSNGSWVEVSPSIFRSYCGRRRMDGRRYLGPRYLFLTFQPIPANQATLD